MLFVLELQRFCLAGQTTAPPLQSGLWHTGEWQASVALGTKQRELEGHTRSARMDVTMLQRSWQGKGSDLAWQKKKQKSERWERKVCSFLDVNSGAYL
jgi:hypothetical protein